MPGDGRIAVEQRGEDRLLPLEPQPLGVFRDLLSEEVAEAIDFYAVVSFARFPVQPLDQPIGEQPVPDLRIFPRQFAVGIQGASEFAAKASQYDRSLAAINSFDSETPRMVARRRSDEAIRKSNRSHRSAPRERST
jgi:hypothetical protein